MLSERIQHVNVFQVAWLTLVFCAATWANYVLGWSIPNVLALAERHDAEVWGCLQRLLGTEIRLTCLGLRSAVRTSPAAHWASWANNLSMIQKRHPAVDRLFVAWLFGRAEGPHSSGATVSRERLLDQSRCPHVDPDCRWFAPQPPRRRWRARSASTGMAVLRKPSREIAFFDMVLCHFCRTRNGVVAFDAGHHRSVCAVSGVLGRRGFVLESAAVRVCREAGGKVTFNVRVNDLDLPPRGWTGSEAT